MKIDNRIKGDCLKKLRKESGLTVDQIINIVDIGETTYNRIEAGGNCRTETLEDIITLGLGMKVSSFYRIVETKQSGETTTTTPLTVEKELAEYLCAVSDSIVALVTSRDTMITKLDSRSESPHIKRALTHIKKLQQTK